MPPHTADVSVISTPELPQSTDVPNHPVVFPSEIKTLPIPRSDIGALDRSPPNADVEGNHAEQRRRSCMSFKSVVHVYTSFMLLFTLTTIPATLLNLHVIPRHAEVILFLLLGGLASGSFAILPAHLLLNKLPGLLPFHFGMHLCWGFMFFCHLVLSYPRRSKEVSSETISIENEADNCIALYDYCFLYIAVHALGLVVLYRLKIWRDKNVQFGTTSSENRCSRNGSNFQPSVLDTYRKLAHLYPDHQMALSQADSMIR